jgi:predicted DNA-binding transcriptional regulator AlpA
VNAPSAALASGKNEAPSAPAVTADRLITAREVTTLLGLKCRTAHTALSYARRGLIRAVRLNARVVRFSEASVRALIEGRVG